MDLTSRMKQLRSSRLNRMASGIFAEVAQWKEAARARGIDVIDLSIGSPDRPPSARIMDALSEAARDPENYGYPGSRGSREFRAAAAEWYKRRFGASLDPEREVLALMGSQDGLAHLALALTDPGDTAIVPDPGYPIYAAALAVAGVRPYYVPLRAANGFLPQLDQIPQETAERAKYILLNYPGNPTAAVADRAFFGDLVAFARKSGLLIVHDLAYSELAFDGFHPTSILEIEGAKEISIELHSLSKSFHMAGVRLGFAVGNADVLDAIAALKNGIDFGVFAAVQAAGVKALRDDIARMEASSSASGGSGPDGSAAGVYEARRDALVAGMRSIGWNVPNPKATMFIWAPIPDERSSRQFARDLLERAGVAVVPGDAFGKEGEGYVRIALVQEEERLLEAVERIGQFLRDR
ncbi:LL-diaminopimelate aminotransferase [Paenibacillus sp. CECT 9249]|nr:LL-diaminopimelate aminotransferase [Paenibacillus sp. CECT 9249]